MLSQDTRRSEASVADVPIVDTSQTRQIFLVKPFLQLGASTHGAKNQSLRLAWHTDSEDVADWTVEVRICSARGWQEWHTCSEPSTVDLSITNVGKRKRFLVTMDGLKAGKRFQYRLRANEQIVFSARATAPKTAKQPFRFVVLGDGADGGDAAAAVAHRIATCNPDLLLFAGDNAYEDGRVSEYEREFFPIYNAEQNDAQIGASLLRQVVSSAVAGNHDVRTPGFESRANQDVDADDQSPTVAQEDGEVPDILGYFMFFANPENGPQLTTEQMKAFTVRKKKRKRIGRFVGKKFLSRTNFSFDYGNVHVLMLDGNKYADWTNEHLRAWLEADLQAAQATWKVVVIHQPPFTGGNYANEQRNRLLCEIFQNNGVDVVFSGHCHTYERTFPLRFFPNQHLLEPATECVKGTLALDHDYDGKINTHANGVVYIVTGAGGKIEAYPHHPKQVETTCKLVEDQPSFTMCDVRGRTLIIRQLGVDGSELDSFMIDK